MEVNDSTATSGFESPASKFVPGAVPQVYDPYETVKPEVEIIVHDYTMGYVIDHIKYANDCALRGDNANVFLIVNKLLESGVISFKIPR